MQPCPYVCLRAVFSTAGSAAAFAPAADHLISPPSPHICCPLTHLPAVQSAPLPIVPCQVVGFPRHGASASRCFFARRSRPVMNSLVFNLAPLSSRSQPSPLGSHHAATCLPATPPLICLSLSPTPIPSEQHRPPTTPPPSLLHLELVCKLFSHHSSLALPLLYLYSMRRPWRGLKIQVQPNEKPHHNRSSLGGRQENNEAARGGGEKNNDLMKGGLMAETCCPALKLIKINLSVERIV